MRSAWYGRWSALLPVVLRSQRGEERVVRQGAVHYSPSYCDRKGVRSAWRGMVSALLLVVLLSQKG